MTTSHDNGAPGGLANNREQIEPSRVVETEEMFPVVGIGASAGGLEAFTALVSALTDDTGMAFVAVPHLDPAHPSALSEILARSTSMPVIEIVDGQVIAPNTIYVLPPGQDMTIEGSRLLLQPRPSACCIDQSTLPHVFDLFRQGASESSHRVSGLASGSHLCAASWNCTAGVTASSPGIDRAASSSSIS